MNRYLSMEYLKLRHSHISWVVVATNIIANVFTSIWLLPTSLPNNIRLATFQNNFTTIWLYTGLTVLAFEKARQEQVAGNFFNVRQSVIDMPTYYHALVLNLYWLFFKGLVLYEVLSLTFIAFTSGISDLNLYQGIVLPMLFIALFASWLLPVIYLLIINLPNFITVLAVLSLLISGVGTLPTPWSVATYNIAHLAGVNPNGLAIDHYSNSLIGPAIITTFVMVALLEGILYLHTRRQNHAK
ncbi:hypothetical protein ACAW68_01730 [Weissella confusa]|uniref:hypothetical protein n=1 Tax=Weissella confusa TaxID=1583 RepID=UPI0035A2A7F1